MDPDMTTNGKGPIMTNKNKNLVNNRPYKMMKFCKVAKWTSCVSCQRISAGFTSGFSARMTKKCAKGQPSCTVKKVCGVGEYDRQMRWMPTEFAKDLDPLYGASRGAAVKQFARRCATLCSQG